MLIYRDNIKNISNIKNCTLVIGNFDGIHLGHKKLISKARKIAHDTPLIMMSFSPHPREFFGKKNNEIFKHIDNFHIKIQKLTTANIDYLINLRFTQKLADMSAKDFVEEIIIKQISPKNIITGEDFAFGKNRIGNAEFLKRYSNYFNYLAVKKLKINDEICSSSNIRKYIINGDIKNASTILGENYAISGRVCHGKKRGRIIGFPTLNIPIKKNILTPKFGVYSVIANINKTSYKAIANIGIRPSFGINEPLLEVYLLNFKGDLYGKYGEINFQSFIRTEQKFKNIDELKNQIKLDILTIS